MTELAVPPTERRLPPVEWISVLSTALAIVSTIYLAWHLPRRPTLGPAIGLLAFAGILFFVDLGLLARVRDFGWHTFRTVGCWSLVGYLIIAGMLEYVFIYDKVPGAMLALMTLSLATFTLNVVLILAFSVARFQPR